MCRYCKIARDFVLFFLFISSNAHGLLRPPCLIYLYTSSMYICAQQHNYGHIFPAVRVGQMHSLLGNIMQACIFSYQVSIVTYLTFTYYISGTVLAAVAARGQHIHSSMSS